MNNDLVKFKLKKKVCSIRVDSFKAIVINNEIFLGEKENYFDECTFKSFNVNGFLTTYLKYNIDDSLIFKNIYHYDDKGILIQVDVNDYDDDIEYKIFFRYDEMNNLIEKSYHYPDGSVDFSKFMNDNNGNCLEQLDFDTNGKLISKFKFDYDNNGRCLNQIEDDIIIRKNYDNYGNLTRVISRRYGERNDYEVYYTYYPNGDIKSEKRYFDEPDKKWALELVADDFFTYKYDANQNWISKTVYSKNIPKYIIIRQIEYYED